MFVKKLFLLPPLILGIYFLAMMSFHERRADATGCRDPLLLSATSLDFGTVGYFDEPSRQLLLQNTGAKRIVVKLTADCSCVTVTPPVVSLQAGSSHVVSLRMKRSASGAVVKGVRYIDRELTLSATMDGLVTHESVPLRVAFEEPLLVQADARLMQAELFVEAKHRIGVAAQTEVERVDVLRVSGFVSAAHIEWNQDFNSGWIYVTAVPTVVGNEEGELVLLVQSREGEPAELSIPLVLVTRDPVRASPEFLTLDLSAKKPTLTPVTLRSDNSKVDIIQVEEIEPDFGLQLAAADELCLTLPDKASPVLLGNRREVGSEVQLQMRVTSDHGQDVSYIKSLPVVVWVD